MKKNKVTTNLNASKTVEKSKVVMGCSLVDEREIVRDDAMMSDVKQMAVPKRANVANALVTKFDLHTFINIGLFAGVSVCARWRDWLVVFGVCDVVWLLYCRR